MRLHGLVEADEMCSSIHDDELYNVPLTNLDEAWDDSRLVASAAQDDEVDRYVVWDPQFRTQLRI